MYSILQKQKVHLFKLWAELLWVVLSFCLSVCLWKKCLWKKMLVETSVALATESSGYVWSRTLCDILLFLLLPLLLFLVLFLSCISYDSLVHCYIITNLDFEIFSHRQTDREIDRWTDQPTKVDLEGPPPGVLNWGQGRVQKLFWVVVM